MKFRYSSARKGRKPRWLGGWWLGRKKHAERLEPRVSASGFVPGELAVRLDDTGRILGCSESLARRLSRGLADSGVHFGNIVTQSFDWLEKPTAQWPATLPLVSFLTGGGAKLHCAGVMQREGGSWSIMLVDISASLTRLEIYQDKALLLRKTADFAFRIGAARGAVHDEVEDWLEQMALRLRIPWMAVVVREGEAWQLCGLFQQPGVAVSLPDFNDIQFRAGHVGRVAPVQYQGVNGEVLWLVPYSESGQVQAWLYCGGFYAVESDLWLSDDEWHYLFAMLAAPVLRNVRRQAERRAESRRNTLEQLLCGGWWEYYPDTSTLRLSPSLMSHLGVTFQDEDGLPLEQWLALVDPLDRSTFQLRLDAMAEGKLTQTLRFRIGGAPRWYQLEGVLTPTPQGPCVIGFALDVGDVRAREEEAAAAKARLYGLIDSAPGIIYVMGYEDGALQQTFCSASVESLLGWDLDTFLKRPYAGFIHGDDREDYFSHIRALLQSGRSSCQYRMVDTNGGYHWMQDEALLLRNERGIPVEVVGLCLDITETKVAVEQVIVSEERYRALVDASPAIICRYRPDLQLTFANPMLIVTLGLAADSSPLVNFGDFLSSDERQRALQRFGEMTPENPIANSEIRVLCGGAQSCWWVVSERGLFDGQGNLVEVQAVARDNTEVHEARQQLFQSAKMATLGEMATGLAHEINQPLNVMHITINNLLARLAKDAVPLDYLTNKLERIADQVQRTAGIVDRMRVFGRQSDMEGLPFNPDDSITAAVGLVEEMFKKDSVELEVSGEALPAVRGHADGLAQVLVNLLINACYAVIERRSCVSTFQPRTAMQYGVEDDVVVISVKDNGGGINPEMIDRIFEPFFTTKPVGEGTGLGLSVSYAIIKQMSGSLFVSNNGDGAVFTIELPVAAKAVRKA